jgi:hypothetical protein
VRAKPSVERKRPQPASSPKATPPPKAKRAPPPTRGRTSTKKKSERTPTPPTPRTAKVLESFSESMREYALSQRVRAGGGTLKSEADDTQFRFKIQGVDVQLWENPEHECCRLQLDEWGKARTDFTCMKCNETRKRPLLALAESFGFWKCAEHDLFVCLSCNPVEIKTILDKPVRETTNQ